MRENMKNRRTNLPVGFLAAFAALLGCDKSEGADGEEEAVVACAAAESQAACEAIGSPAYQCGWVQTITVTAEAPCESSVTQQCIPYAKGAFPPGCSPSMGCQNSDPNQPGMLVRPAYREGESGATLLVNECGGDAFGFTACESGAADADVPACACVCESAP